MSLVIGLNMEKLTQRHFQVPLNCQENRRVGEMDISHHTPSSTAVLVLSGTGYSRFFLGKP